MKINIVFLIIIIISSLKLQKLVSEVLQYQGLPDRLNDFTWKLYSYLSLSQTDNFFISPFSIFTALAMTTVGARNLTELQLKNFLCLNVDQQEMLQMFANYFDLLKMVNNKDTTLNVANRIFTKKENKLYQDFNNSLNTYFQSGIEQLDFSKSNESARIINGWVANKTNNKITNLIDPSLVNQLTEMFVINAIYFKGKWLNQFAAFRTSRMNFTLVNGSLVVVDMMRNNKERLNTQVNPAGLNAISCEIPYTGTASMTIILPHKNSSIQELEANLTSSRLKQVLSGSYYVKTDLFLPKFNINLKTDLADVVKNMGAPIAFDRQQADFSGIMPLMNDQRLFISSIQHQSTIQVTENGTEASAATAVVIMLTSTFVQPEETITVQADRPFFFVIHETMANGILFIGKLLKP